MKIITTNSKEQIYWNEQEVEKSEISVMNRIEVYPDMPKQTVVGFGGAFTESAGYCYTQLPQTVKEQVIQNYFSEDGLCYTLGRSHINSCDFSLSNYVADEDENDEQFQKFSLEREETYIYPLLQDAQKQREEGIQLLLSPWSPPAYMKTNNDMNHGGALRKEYYERWANYMTYYIKETQKKGYHVQWITVQNEPEATQTWDSCRYTPEEESEFAVDYLRKKLDEEGLHDIKILVWDHNKEAAYKRLHTILKKEGAKEAIAGIGVHWYTGDHFENLAMIREQYPDKEIFFTEGCVEYSRFDASDEVKKAEMYGHDMIGNFKNGVQAFFDWNLLLDSKGGPNHVGNYCDAPMLCKADWSGVEKHVSYYYIGHFSKWVQPGARVIWSSSYCMEVEHVAFLNPDGQRVVVLMNQQEKELEVNVGEGSEGVCISLLPHSIVTICWNN